MVRTGSFLAGGRFTDTNANTQEVSAAELVDYRAEAIVAAVTASGFQLDPGRWHQPGAARLRWWLR